MWGWILIGLGGIGTVWALIGLAHEWGRQSGRLSVLEDVLDGRGWAPGGRPDTKLEQVALSLALAQATLGKQSAVRSGMPTDVTRLLAQTAVAAMRHPTREMLAAVEPFIASDYMRMCQQYYELMIDAATRPDAGPSARGVTPQSVAVIRATLQPFTKELNGHDRKH